MSYYQKDGDRVIIDAFGGESSGQKPTVNIKHSEARCPAEEVITKRPSYVVINNPGSYAFAYESGSADGTLSVYHTGSVIEGFAINSTDSSGSSAAAIKLDINPVAWKQNDADGSVGDVTFVYVRTR